MNSTFIQPVRHGLVMAVAALIFGALWAAYMATHHEQLHGAFEAQEEKAQQAQMSHMMQEMSMDSMQMENAANHNHSSTTADSHRHDHDTAPHTVGISADHHNGHDEKAQTNNVQHSHSGSLAKDAMQRLLRGHIHFMGIGVLAAVLLLITAFTSLKSCWKKTLGFTLGLGALAYPPAWILMGFRTVELGPQAAEASVMWLFAPAVGLLLGSMVALLTVLFIEMMKWQDKRLFRRLFTSEHAKS